MNTLIGKDKDTVEQWNPGLSVPRDHLVGFERGRRPLPGVTRPRARQWRDGSAGNGAIGSMRASEFEKIASGVSAISSQRAKLLGILLAAASPDSGGGRAVLRPIWATEALHRAYNMVRLIARLEQNSPRCGNRAFQPDHETKLGTELAAIFGSLAITNDKELRPCSTPLRDVVRNLIGLFEPTVGVIEVSTSVVRLALPAFQHRALILLSSELVTNCLLHAFRNQRLGRINVRLETFDSGTARLSVMDDGHFMSGEGRLRPAPCSVTAYLADLLRSKVVYRSPVGGGTIAEITIPLV
jgi:hypothetical protein